MAKENQNTTMHFAEDEQTEKIRQWWKRNGLAIIVGLVLGVGSVAGYQGWGVYQTQQAEIASDLYQEMLRSLDNQAPMLARESADLLISKYKSTAYADGALLMLARLDVEAGQLEQAGHHLTTVSAAPGRNHFGRVCAVSRDVRTGELRGGAGPSWSTGIAGL